MLPFTVEIKLGEPIAEQILFAVKKAVVTGRLRPGDKFPSVRQLSVELRINPTTAQKVVASLVDEGLLVTTPAVGSIVTEPETGGKRDQALLLGPELERFVVEAKKLGLSFEDVHASLLMHWRKLGGKAAPRIPHEQHH
jgi:GntR family transcriptional regulator